eukprot:Nk52_evm37s152 gene=Nk52_evmTU37s152
MAPLKVCIVGSGNWGSAIAKIVGANAQTHEEFETDVNIWVFEEMIEGRKLTDIINQDHENVKYLPGIKLPENIIAIPDLVQAASEADILIFVIPHQFVKGTCKSLVGKLKDGCKAISLIKGVDTENGIRLISEQINEILNIDVSVLMGANIANEVAQEKFCETTVGSHSAEDGETFRKLFHTDKFRVDVSSDVGAVELCGALKNVVATGAGFVDGLGLGDNTKAAIIRIGLMEMIKFIKGMYPETHEHTFLLSCGVADLITTCSGGRNRKCAEAFVTTGKTLETLEKEMLNGQKLQGPPTAMEIFHVLKKQGRENEFPLFTVIYRICYEGLAPSRIVEDI